MNKKTLTRADLSESLHRNIGLSRTESADMVNAVLDLVSDALFAIVAFLLHDEVNKKKLAVKM